MNESHIKASPLQQAKSLKFGLLALLIAGLSCIEIPDSPVFPILDVQGSIPLVNRSFSISDFASKDAAITQGLSGGLVYATRQEFEPVAFDSIEMQMEASSQQVVLGSFEVVTPSVPQIGIGIPALPLGIPVVVPATSFPLPTQAVGPLASFEYIEFETGTLTLDVQNDFPFPISFPNPFVLQNNETSAPVDTSIVASFPIAGQLTANGGNQSQVVDLAGVKMLSALRIPTVVLSTPGSGGPVTLNSSSKMQLQLTFSNVTVKSAKARIPTQSILSFADSTFVIDDSVSLSSAFFNSGSFSVVIQNNVDVDIGVFLRFSQLQDVVTGQPFEINHMFTGVGTLNIPINGTDLKFQSLVDSIGTRATFTIGISTISNGDSSREIRNTDNVGIQIVPGPPLILKSVTGRIKPTPLAFQTGSPGFSLGDVSDKFSGSFSFDSVSIGLNFMSSSGFATDYDVSLIAMNRRVFPPKIDSLVVPPPAGSSQRRFFPSNNQTTSIVLDNTTGLNTFLSKFFPNFPDTFIVSGSMTVNPADVYVSPAGKQTIYDTSKIYASVDMSFPLSIGIMNASVWDTVDIGSSENFPKDFTTSSQEGTIYFDVENGIPLSFSFRAALLKSVAGGIKDTLVFIPSDGPRIIAAADVDANGLVTAPVVSRFSITLTGPELLQFGTADLMWIELGVETSNSGDVVSVQETDMIKVRASANIVYRVGANAK